MTTATDTYRNKVIWVADDDENHRYVATRILSREGATVREFADPDALLEALRAADKARPDLLITDAGFWPGEVEEQKIRQFADAARALCPNLPIILYTADEGLERLDAPGVSVLIKAGRTEELRAAVSSRLGIGTDTGRAHG